MHSFAAEIGSEVPVWFRPEDRTQVACNAEFGAAIAIFDKEWRGPAISYITREQLLATGEAFLVQIRREVERVAGVIWNETLAQHFDDEYEMEQAVN